MCVCVQGCRNAFALLPKVGRKAMDESRPKPTGLLGKSQIAFCNDDLCQCYFNVAKTVKMKPSMKLRCFSKENVGSGSNNFFNLVAFYIR